MSKLLRKKHFCLPQIKISMYKQHIFRISAVFLLLFFLVPNKILAQDTLKPKQDSVQVTQNDSIPNQIPVTQNPNFNQFMQTLTPLIQQEVRKALIKEGFIEEESIPETQGENENEENTNKEKKGKKEKKEKTKEQEEIEQKIEDIEEQGSTIGLWFYILVIVGFWAIVFIILILLWQLVKRIFRKLPLKNQRIIYSLAILLGFIFATPLRDIWISLFDYTNIMDSEVARMNLILINTYRIFPLFNIAYFANSVLGYFVWYGALSDKDGSMVPEILIKIVNGLSYLIAAILGVAIIAPQAFSNFLFSIGTTGAVGAFLAREPVKKAFAALSLNIGSTYRQGDLIEIDGKTGTIDEIGWNTIKLVTPEDNRLIVPNETLTNSTVVNISQPDDKKGFTIDVSVNPNITPHKVKTLLKKSAMDSEFVIIARKEEKEKDEDEVETPEEKKNKEVKFGEIISPNVYLSEMRKYSAIYTVEVNTQSYNLDQVKSNVLSSVWYMLRREGLHPAPEEWKVENPIEKAITLINSIDILEPFNEEEDQILAKGSQWLRYGYPERIVSQGDNTASLYIIAEGKVDILIRKEDELVSVAQLGKNQFFGEKSLLTGEAISATVRALGDVLILKIHKDVLGPILSKRQEVLELLSKILAKRQMDTQKKSSKYDEANAQQEEANIAGKLFGLMKGLIKGQEKKK